MRIKKLDNSHFEEIFLLFKEIESNLENHLWLFPCKREWLQSMLATENRKALYGTFSDNNELMAVQGLSPTIKKVIDILKLNEQETIEIGSSVVLPRFRGKGLSTEISKELIEIAKLNGYKNIVAKSHPDNIAGSKTLLNLGMQLMTTIIPQDKYIRNVYLLEI
jgi:RimJ/RimL family protein N-acetyltransferase